MKKSKHFIFFTLSLVGFAVLECLLTALFSPHLEESVFLSRVFPYITRLLAVIPPFLALGAAVDAIRTRGLGYAFIFLGIYAAVSLFSQIPLSLLSLSIADSAPYAVLLLSFMLSSAVTVLLFALVLLFGYALFMQNERVSEDTPFFSVSGNDARVLAIAASLLTLYHIIREIVDIFVYLKEHLYIVAGTDLLSMVLSLFFFLALGVFCFTVGRLGERLFPTPSSAEPTPEDDFI